MKVILKCFIIYLIPLCFMSFTFFLPKQTIGKTVLVKVRFYARIFWRSHKAA